MGGAKGVVSNGLGDLNFNVNWKLVINGTTKGAQMKLFNDKPDVALYPAAGCMCNQVS